jgi:hypothetical protein
VPPFFLTISLCHSLGRTAPLIDRCRVRRKNVKLSLRKLSPRFVVRRRNRCQQRDPGGQRRPERAGKTTPGGFELPELVEQDEVAALRDIALHRCTVAAAATAPIPSRWQSVTPGPKSWKIENRDPVARFRR